MADAADSGAPRKGPYLRQIPHGDDRERLVCQECGFINYENPRVLVGSVVTWQAPETPDAAPRILLCRRAIEPRLGYWTLPAGYMEHGETTEAGAAREAWEEARAKIAIDALIGVYTIVRIGLVQLIYRAKLVDPEISAGPESQEVALFAWDEIPWEDIAFPSVNWALEHYREITDSHGDRADFAPRTNRDDGPPLSQL